MELTKIFMGILVIMCLISSVDTNRINDYLNKYNIYPYHKIEVSSPLGLLVKDFKGKVKITDVLEYTPARLAGLEPGDRILKVNGCKVCNVKTFFEKLEEVNFEEPVNLVIHRVDSCSTFPVDVIPFGAKCK